MATLDVCPWCHTSISFRSAKQWEEGKLGNRTFKCHICKCVFQVEKKVLETGTLEMKGGKEEGAVSSLIRACS